MQLRQRVYGSAVVLDIEGPVDRESGAATHLTVAVNRLVQGGQYTTILLNVHALGKVDSVLLGG